MVEIICIGSSSKDIFFPTSEGMVFDTPEDVTAQKKITFELGAKYQVEDRYESLGGCAANVASGLARLGIKVDCCTKIGDDMLGRWIIENLSQGGVNTACVEIEEKCMSDLSAIIVDEKSRDRTIFFNRDANERLEIKPEMLKKSKWLFVSALNGNWKSGIDNIISIAMQNDQRIVFNPGQRNIKDDVRKILEMIGNTEILMVNKDEAIEILVKSGEEDEKKLNDEQYLLLKLKNYGPRIITLTDGKRGAWVYNKEKILYVGATEKNPTETTGGGDAFTSGFIAAYLKGKNIEECLQWGMANGASVVNYYGANKGLLDEYQMEERLKLIKIDILNKKS